VVEQERAARKEAAALSSVCGGDEAMLLSAFVWPLLPASPCPAASSTFFPYELF